MPQSDKAKEEIKLDQILKVLFRLSKKVMVNLLNGLFDENFCEDDVNIEYSNSEFMGIYSLQLKPMKVSL